MASIFKRPDGKYWFAAFRAADGRRIKVSTKTADKAEARLVADRLQLEATQLRESRIRESSLAGVNDALVRAAKHVQTGTLDAQVARELIGDLLVAAGHERLGSVTNRSWGETWKRERAGTVKSSSRQKYDQLIRNWLTFLRAKADHSLESLTREDVVAYREHLSNAGLSASTINQIMKMLRGVHSAALEQGILGRNPFSGLSPLRRDETRARRIPFTQAEVAVLIEKADGDWKGVVLLSATTGLRLMDATRLKWDSIDLDSRVLRVRTAKTGASLILPVHPEFADWLGKQVRGIGNAPVFPSLAGKSGPGKSGLSMAFKRLMDRAGVEDGIIREPGKKTKGRATSAKSFHSLRHFAATQLASNGVRADVARAITGHADALTHANYVTPSVEALRAAVGGIQLGA